LRPGITDDALRSGSADRTGLTDRACEAGSLRPRSSSGALCASSAYATHLARRTHLDTAGGTGGANCALNADGTRRPLITGRARDTGALGSRLADTALNSRGAGWALFARWTCDAGARSARGSDFSNRSGGAGRTFRTARADQAHGGGRRGRHSDGLLRRAASHTVKKWNRSKAGEGRQPGGEFDAFLRINCHI